MEGGTPPFEFGITIVSMGSTFFRHYLPYLLSASLPFHQLDAAFPSPSSLSITMITLSRTSLVRAVPPVPFSPFSASELRPPSVRFFTASMALDPYLEQLIETIQEKAAGEVTNEIKAEIDCESSRQACSSESSSVGHRNCLAKRTRI